MSYIRINLSQDQKKHWKNELDIIHLKKSNVTVETAFREFESAIYESTYKDFDFSIFVPFIKFTKDKESDFPLFTEANLLKPDFDGIWGFKEISSAMMRRPLWNRSIEKALSIQSISSFPEFIQKEGFPCVLNIESYDRGHQPIRIETLTGKKFEVLTTWSSPISAIKKQIQIIEGIPIDQQRLICNGKQLEDSRTLPDYLITKNDKLDLVLRLRGGMYHQSSGLLFAHVSEPTGRRISLTEEFHFSKKFQIGNQIQQIHFEEGCSVVEVFEFVAKQANMTF